MNDWIDRDGWRLFLGSRLTHTEAADLTPIGRACNAYHRVTRWVRWSWWRYILERPEPNTGTAPYWIVVACRLRGHAGEVYYNPGGLEPDHSCRRCGEEIG